MESKKIILTTQIPEWVQAKIKNELPGFEVLRISDSSLASLSLNNVKGALVRSQTKVDKKFISQFKDLEIVGTATSGFDHIDFKFLNDQKILSFYCPEANAFSTADLTLLHLLMSLRNNFSYNTRQVEFKWKNQIQLGSEANKKSLGLVGFGRIGKQVARRALAFGFNVYFHDPYLPENEYSDYPGLTSLSLLELFTHCEIISLHVPLTQKTRHLIDNRTLDHFGEDKVLINCARGELIKDQDILKALDHGIIKHLGLDTFSEEPLSKSSPLWNHPKVFWSPHIGAYTNEAFEKSCLEASESLIAFFKDKQAPQQVLPPNKAWACDL